MLLLRKSNHKASTSSPSSSNSKIRCEYCQKTFKTKWTLSSHVAAHEGRFQFQCCICNKRFVRKSHYESHVRSHDAARPYVCEHCGWYLLRFKKDMYVEIYMKISISLFLLKQVRLLRKVNIEESIWRGNIPPVEMPYNHSLTVLALAWAKRLHLLLQIRPNWPYSCPWTLALKKQKVCTENFSENLIKLQCR